MNKKELTPAQINMLPKSARPINVAPLSEKDDKYADRVRHGKTKRDKERKGH